MAAAADPARTRPGRVPTAVLLSFIVIISSVAAVGIIVGTTFFSTTRVTTPHDARHLQYGFPFRWVTQDQSAFLQRPTLPTDESFASPMENPTDADPADLGYDFLILGFGPPVLVAVGAGLIRRCLTGKPSPIARDFSISNLER